MKKGLHLRVSETSESITSPGYC